MNLSCLTCKQHIARYRGNCPECYRQHAREVLVGKTTWEELEQKGLITTIKQRGFAWKECDEKRLKSRCRDT